MDKELRNKMITAAQKATNENLMYYLRMYTPYHSQIDCTNATEMEYHETYQIILEEVEKRLTV